MDEAWGKAKARGLFKVHIDEENETGVSLPYRGWFPYDSGRRPQRDQKRGARGAGRR
jgi:hypothetical protein